ncbi:MAG: hypothetical protein HDS32_06510 [Bacteroides sp.]|nr:hypothetical protein [Bacteroides sp.]
MRKNLTQRSKGLAEGNIHAMKGAERAKARSLVPLRRLPKDQDSSKGSLQANSDFLAR